MANNKPIMKSVNASVFYSNCYVGPQQIIFIYPNTKYTDVCDISIRRRRGSRRFLSYEENLCDS
jgi:hypothetical protein